MEKYILVCILLGAVVIIHMLARVINRPKFWSFFGVHTARIRNYGERREIILICVPVTPLPKEWFEVKKIITEMGYRLGTPDEIWYTLDDTDLHIPVIVGCEPDSEAMTLYSISTRENRNVCTSGLRPNEVHYCLVPLPK
jgi:hypothetical protein